MVLYNDEIKRKEVRKMTSNQYENDQVIRNRIIELTSDYQSIC